MHFASRRHGWTSTAQSSTDVELLRRLFSFDWPRPRLRGDLSVSVNHGGVAIVAAPGVSLEPWPMSAPASAF